MSSRLRRTNGKRSRSRMKEDRAFAFLVRASNHGNIRLRAVAREIVDEHNRR
jgi:hypothetical protein